MNHVEMHIRKWSNEGKSDEIPMTFNFFSLFWASHTSVSNVHARFRFKNSYKDGKTYENQNNYIYHHVKPVRLYVSIYRGTVKCVSVCLYYYMQNEMQ